VGGEAKTGKEGAMKTITLYEPWASLIAVGAKRIETRSWPTNFRGELAIHAAASFPSWVKDMWRTDIVFRDAMQRMQKPGWWPPTLECLPRGVIVATCKLVDCCKIRPPYYPSKGLAYVPLVDSQQYRNVYLHTPEYLFGDYTPGRYAWILADIKPLPVPIPAKGRQGLWEWEQ
jgi:hypothetical protein